MKIAHQGDIQITNCSRCGKRTKSTMCGREISILKDTPENQVCLELWLCKKCDPGEGKRKASYGRYLIRG